MSIETSFLTSLGLRFYGGEAPPLLLSYNKNSQIGPPSLAHLVPKEYVEYSYISQALFDEYFKFAFVRNPWERAVSFYKHFNFHRVMSFTDFLKYELPVLVTERAYFVQPQVNYLFDEKNLQLVDFIGRFEQLDSDFEKVRTKLPIAVHDLTHINKSLVKRNVYSRWNIRYIWKLLKERPTRIRFFAPFFNSNKPYRELYTPEARNIVDEIYKKDIELLGYTF